MKNFEDSRNDTDGEFGEIRFGELIECARNGSGDALNQLAEGCRNYLLLIANHELDIDLRKKVGASDIVQSSLINVTQHIADFEGNNQDQFLAWARAILVNQLKRKRRDYKSAKKRDVRKEKSIDATGYSSQFQKQLVDGGPTPSTQAASDEQTRLVKQAVRSLPEDYQHVIQYRNWEQKSFSDIAQLMNRSEDAVQKLWKRAISRLEQDLRKRQVL